MTREFFPMVFILALAALPSSAQSLPAPGRVTGGLSPYGTGEGPALVYAGETLPRNALLLSFFDETTYDDNVFSNNAKRRADVIYGFGSRLALRHTRQKLTLALDYEPSVQLYGKTAGYNQWNQGLQFDLHVRPHRRVELRLRNQTRYSTGIFSPSTEQPFLSQLNPGTGLNKAVFTPLARQLETDTRVDAIYQSSRRSSLAVFGGYSQLHFSQVSNPQLALFNTHAASGGFQYVYRFGSRTAFGPLYLFQDILHGKLSRAISHGAFLSLVHAFSPGIRLDLFSGVQSARLEQSFLLQSPVFSLSGRLARSNWRGAGGGTITFQNKRTALQLFAQRQVSDGGGLLPAVTSSSGGVGIRRRLSRRWELAATLEAARTDSLDKLFFTGAINSQRAALSVEWAIGEHYTARAGYQFARQRANSLGPLLADFEGNRVYFGFFYRLRPMGL